MDKVLAVVGIMLLVGLLWASWPLIEHRLRARK